MKLENRMSIGYVKGKFWMPDTLYARYAELPAYKALVKATTKAGFGTNVEYSYTAQRYMAEIITIERFEKSAKLYVIKHNNSYHPNPMAALTMAIRASGRTTPLLLACCLELECELLREAVAAARKREAIMAKLETAIDGLRAVIDIMPVTLMQGDTVIGTARIGELRGKPLNSITLRVFTDEDDDL